ncbi:hypothetical protein XBO1_1300219 [Xenorhabdus bovienii str. oregonense]|uniref:Uncharacterized protein n=1 Tax=Xenorhabdus bovienii str. oregonense TaxID=1398202 RepID=A0A077P0W4_XENBV|nr:hypothetical protein XBO1_1300219 [Xenorhabdus bovienii str. oregonense]
MVINKNNYIKFFIDTLIYTTEKQSLNITSILNNKLHRKNNTLNVIKDNK